MQLICNQLVGCSSHSVGVMEGWWSGLTRLFAKEKDFGSTGSNPVPSSNMWMVAQLVEFWLVTPEVAGSGPVYPPTARSPSLF